MYPSAASMSAAALKFIPLFFSCALLVVIYEIGRRIKNEVAGLLAAFFYALPPQTLLDWGTKARGGFIEIPFSILAALLLGFLANANIFYTGQNAIGRGEGGIMLYFFFLFMVYIFVVARRKKTEDEAPIVGQPLIKSVLLIIVGVIALYFGGGWVVDGATHIALLFGISESVIGLTIVAVGTSLPDLVTSAVAAYKNNTDMAVGNAIGSNIFNILWILGFTSILTPIPFNDHSNQDILMVLISTSALIMAVLIGKKPRISRWEGAIFMLIYCGYLYSLIQR